MKFFRIYFLQFFFFFCAWEKICPWELLSFRLKIVERVLPWKWDASLSVLTLGWWFFSKKLIVQKSVGFFQWPTFYVNFRIRTFFLEIISQLYFHTLFISNFFVSFKLRRRSEVQFQIKSALFLLSSYSTAFKFKYFNTPKILRNSFSCQHIASHLHLFHFSFFIIQLYMHAFLNRQRARRIIIFDLRYVSIYSFNNCLLGSCLVTTLNFTLLLEYYTNETRLSIMLKRENAKKDTRNHYCCCLWE